MTRILDATTHDAIVDALTSAAHLLRWEVSDAPPRHAEVLDRAARRCDNALNALDNTTGSNVIPFAPNPTSGDAA